MDLGGQQNWLYALDYSVNIVIYHLDAPTSKNETEKGSDTIKLYHDGEHYNSVRTYVILTVNQFVNIRLSILYAKKKMVILEGWRRSGGNKSFCASNSSRNEWSGKRVKKEREKITKTPPIWHSEERWSTRKCQRQHWCDCRRVERKGSHSAVKIVCI